MMTVHATCQLSRLESACHNSEWLFSRLIILIDSEQASVVCQVF